MARNIEIKAAIDSIDNLKIIAKELADKPPILIGQKDIFFKSTSGRLKLRFLNDNTGQLIVYNRPDEKGPKHCEYKIYKTDNPRQLKEILEVSNEIIGEVKKSRLLYMVGRTRIHLDSVTGLGEFLELEVILSDSEADSDGLTEAYALMDKLNIDKSQLISGAYFDLLNQSKNTGSPISSQSLK